MNDPESTFDTESTLGPEDTQAPESAQRDELTTEQIAAAGRSDAGNSGLNRTFVPGPHTLADEETGEEVVPQSRVRQAEFESDPDTGAQPQQLLEDDELYAIRAQWKDIQSEFVDEPRTAIQEADALVADLMQRLAQTFAAEREQLESRWSGGEDVYTEDLRQGLRRYRSFFERLLAA